MSPLKKVSIYRKLCVFKGNWRKESDIYGASERQISPPLPPLFHLTLTNPVE